MVDPGESFTRTLKREIVEEATEESSVLQNALDKGRVVYTGIVDDPRETNNAWIETAAVHAHITAEEAQTIVLRPAVDGETTSSTWVDVTDEVLTSLYANHGHMITLAMRAARLPIRSSTRATLPFSIIVFFVCTIVVLALCARASGLVSSACLHGLDPV
jgi:hypothetical protein